MSIVEQLALLLTTLVSMGTAGAAIYAQHQKNKLASKKLAGEEETSDQSFIEKAAEIFERYAVSLGKAYNEERSLRESLDRDVARLNHLVSMLQFRIEDLTFQVARLTGTPPKLMPILVDETSFIKPTTILTPTEKLEEVVGPKPDLESIAGGAGNGANGANGKTTARK